ncbi:acrosomal protein SP-10 isoform X2 [Dipodomys spectabilis]|uniref:acrosomal protein SP-10 isoform X2 n=1 Tax=Dipodomys spectabilis TaxID=105255 RepID=UPI001C545BE7|nr:acrosomal protein SP-10 isoform X2 [Dipodomys spectabilis]
MNKLILLISLYLLGSAREASGKPDESLGSMAHQASIQQLSGEYFSLGNPSHIDALYETSGKNALSEHGSTEHATIEHGSTEHATMEHSSTEHATMEHAFTERASSEHFSSEHNSGEQSSGDKSASDQSSGDQSSGEHTSVDQSSSDQSSGEHSSEQSPGEQSSVEQLAGEKGMGEQSSGSALNCHTCAYMNDQGKCLRGEGVCTTQNSQQCMLKKIYEAGKLQFMVQGCENMCPSMNLFSHGTRMQIICCRNQPFCNKT